MAKSTPAQVAEKANSWLKNGLTFYALVMHVPKRRVFQMLDHSVYHDHHECEAIVRIRQVDFKSNRVTCNMKIKLPTMLHYMDDDVLWEGEIVEGPKNSSGKDDGVEEANTFDVSNHWHQLFPNHSLSEASFLYKLYPRIPFEAKPCRTQLLQEDLTQVSFSAAATDYIWVRLARVAVGAVRAFKETPMEGTKDYPQLLLSIRRSDGSVEGCMGKNMSDMMLLYAQPDFISRRGGSADLSSI